MTKTQFMAILNFSRLDYDTPDYEMSDQYGDYLDWNLPGGRTDSAFISKYDDEQNDYSILEAGDMVQQ